MSRWTRGITNAAVAMTLACLGAIANSAHAQTTAANAAQGRVLADKLCKGCHVTAADTEGVVINPDVPSFAAIARRPGIDAELLAGRVIIPHPPMPDTHLTVTELRDIIAYILSMTPKR